MKTLVTALLVAPLAFLGSATAPALAQSNSLGAIVSSVRDSTGHPVVGALVVASGPTTREAQTNSAGIVTLLGLPPGTYSVRVTRAGFSPFGEVVKVGSQSDGVKTLNVLVTPENFATVGSEFGSTLSAPFDAAKPLYVAPAVLDSLSANILASGNANAPIASVGPALEGTSPNETRVELDGIPLAGAASNAAALRFRSALDLADVTFVEGPALASPSLQDAIGGIVGYRTQAIAPKISTQFDSGYDSVFDSYEHARYGDTFGKVGVLVDAVEGDDGNESGVLKARLDLSRATSIAFATYQDRDSFLTGAVTTVNDAPASAADVRTMLGNGTLQGRVFESRSDTNAGFENFSHTSQAWQTNGFSFDYALPIGEDLTTIGYDRRVERVSFDAGPDALESIATLRLATDIQLTHLSRLELGDDLASGTDLPHRNDPQIALALRTGNNVNVRLAAGSAYATVAETLLAAVTPGTYFAPESSFGYRASVDVTTHAADHIRVAAFEVRRSDTFDELSDARSAGLELGYQRDAAPGRLGVDAGFDLTRTDAFGSQQPLARYDLAEQQTPGAQLDGNPYSKARLALTYRVDGTELRFGTTLLGANNALSTSSVVLGDCSLTLPFAPLGDLRIGIENLFGQSALDPQIAPLFPPRELTIGLERS